MTVLYLTLFESVTGNGIYETQVKSFLCRLADRYGDKVAVTHLAFLPALVIGRTGVSCSFLDSNGENARVRSDYHRHGIDCRLAYVPVPVLKRWKSNISLPLLMLVLITAGPMLLYNMLRRPVEIVHCRSYVAALLALGMKLIFPRLKVIFDPRGFYPEEGVVTGKWSAGSLAFKCWKGLESILVRRCDSVIALSEPFAKRLRQISPAGACSVIYASADTERFERARECREKTRKELGLEGKTVFIYSGGLGAWHDPAMLARVYKSLSDACEKPHLVVLTQYDAGRLLAIFWEAGISDEEVRIISAEPMRVPDYLGACDYGIVPLKVTSKGDAMSVVAETMIGTKVAEYLASGLPLIVNSAVGGLKTLMAHYYIGTWFDESRPDGAVAGLLKMRKEYQRYQEDCELVASRFLSLDNCVRSYQELYCRLAGVPGPCPSLVS